MWPHLEKKDYSKVGAGLNVYWDKKAMKQLKKLMRKAISSGWFDRVENPYNE